MGGSIREFGFKVPVLAALIPTTCCPYCQRTFQPSRRRPDQAVCCRLECQARRRNDYRRRKRQTDTGLAHGRGRRAELRFLTSIGKRPYGIWMLEGFDQRESWFKSLLGR